MGAGRRTLTFTFNDNNDKGVATPYSPRGGTGNFKALKKSDLAMVIFVYSRQTFKECIIDIWYFICPFFFSFCFFSLSILKWVCFGGQLIMFCRALIFDFFYSICAIN